MLCQNCGKNEATTHIKQVINGDTAERHLCSECAEHLGYGDAFSGFGFDVAGLFGNFGQCAYAAAKEGIRGLTRVAANEWGKDGINVNIVCPLAWTAQLEKFEQAYPDAFKANVKVPPMGHFGDVEKEIGRACVALASPDFKYMSGETITLEGGMGLRP